MRTVDKDNPVALIELAEMSEKMFGNLVKAVVDVDQRVMMVDAELHADEEDELLETGSKQADLWGINLYPEFFGTEDFIEFDSMINIRPMQDNRSRGVDDEQLRSDITRIVAGLVRA